MSQPSRILQVVGTMGPMGGGAEKWLMDVYRRIDRSRFQFDFLVHTPERFPLHDEIESLGGRLLRTCRPLYVWKYGRYFRRLMADRGPYDLCHVHVPFCGYALHLARTVGIPVRIAHAHNSSYSLGVSWGIRQFLWWTNRWVSRDATSGLACSRAAALALFGPQWERDPRWRIHYCGINLRSFSGPVDGAKLKRELGIPEGAFVIGHVGRFQPEKNHEFVVAIAAETFRREPRGWLLLVGDGPLRERVVKQVQSLDVAHRVVFAGARKDVADLMRGAIDVLLLPSLFEGFSLVGLETQAAGLPVVFSDDISGEFVVNRDLVRVESLNAGPGAWADHVLALRGIRASRAVGPSLEMGERFSIEGSVRGLEAFYQESRGEW